MRVAFARVAPAYPEPPFHPSERYPEYPYGPDAVSSTPNAVYGAVRECLRRLGLDEENYGTARWNPLRGMIDDGARVIVKPNFVNHRNPLSDDQPHFDALVTHPAVMRPLIDYVTIAAPNDVCVTVADLPIQSANFEILRSRSGLDRVMDFVASRLVGRGQIRVLDLRDYWLRTDRAEAIIERLPLPGDPKGYVVVDLGSSSSLRPIERHAALFRAPDYDGRATVEMHSGGRHRYVLPRTVLESTAFINVPKLKVHRKVGATLSLKNLVGIIGDKSCLPHWRAGSPARCGDEYPVDSTVNRLASRWSFPLRKMGGSVWRTALPIGRLLKKLDVELRGGAPLARSANGDWYGNDTVWRMVHDLNRILFHADAEGRLHDGQQRAYLTLVDGVMAGEGEGPLRPTPVAAGTVIAGTDPLAVDIVCSRLMGFDWRRIPLLAGYDVGGAYPFSEFSGNPATIDVRSGDHVLALEDIVPVADFTPALAWRGHIELERDGDAAANPASTGCV
jgi:uncharacterized protein (DUF362 family)